MLLALGAIAALIGGATPCATTARAQDARDAAPTGADRAARAEYAIVRDVVVEGNRKTRRPFVLREMSLRPGDTLWLDRLEETLDLQRRLLLNTNLFSEVELLVSTLVPERREAILRAVVREKWYFYPAVDFDLADRNFTVWWEEQGAALDRVNYGLKLRHGNTTGRGDRLTLFGQWGYTRKAEVRYEVPYVDAAKTFGVELGALYNQNREWAARTVDGRLTFFDLDTANVLTRRRLQVAGVFKPGLYVSHVLRLQRQDNRIAAVLAEEVNPEFLGDRRRRQRFYGLRYQVTYDRRDVRPFPLRGDFVRLAAEKVGLGAGDDINRLFFSAEWRRYQPLGGPLYLNWTVKAKTDVERTASPYYNRIGLGYDDSFLRGYQFYVVDGLDYAFARTTLQARVWDRPLRLRWVPIRRLQTIPFRVFAGVHGDVGGANDPFGIPGNVLADRVLTSYGAGLYAVFFYGKVARFELTRNGLGETGGYVSYSLSF